MRYIISYSTKLGKPKSPNYPGYEPYGSLAVQNLTNAITNPWREPTLRKLNGLHPEVQAYVMRCPKTKLYITWGIGRLHYGKDILFSCSGGKHRSVAMAELVAAAAREKYPLMEITVIHRDINVKAAPKKKKTEVMLDGAQV